MRRSRLLSIAIVALVPLAFATPAHPASNKLPNGGFEDSAFGTAPDAGGAADIWQPLLPEGWAFEGSAGLFDHADERGSGGARSAHGGFRFAAISIPASGKPRVCSGVDPSLPNQCADLRPVSDAKRAASLAYSADPTWRNAVPVRVSGGQTYTLSHAAAWELLSSGSTVFSKVRWLDAGGAPISVSAVTTTIITRFSESRGWMSYSNSVRAPGAARQAVVLLGVSDDTFIGQVRFDDVFFG